MAANMDPVQIHDTIEELSRKICQRCYDLYGPDASEERAKKVLQEYIIEGDDPELHRCLRELVEYERMASESNPWIDLV